jgi:hypothetical protein
LPGGHFNFGFNVLPGDVNRNGTANTQDLSIVQSRLNVQHSDPAPGRYNPFADLNASGVINTQDLSIIQSRLNTQLPPTPSPASSPALALGTPSNSAPLARTAFTLYKAVSIHSTRPLEAGKQSIFSTSLIDMSKKDEVLGEKQLQL